MDNRNWEKGISAPIPTNKYERFKEKLIEYSPKYSERNLMLFVLARATIQIKSHQIKEMHL